MIFLLIFSVLVSGIIGKTIFDFLFRGNQKKIAYSLFSVAFGVGIGTGLTSSLYYSYKMFFSDSGAGYRIFEPAMALLLIFGCLSIRKKSATVFDIPEERSARPDLVPTWMLRLIFSVLLLGGVASYVFLSMARPHGAWDAWGIWNLRARFIFRGKAGWTDAFLDVLDWFKPDYPNLLPGAVARAWEFMGSDPCLGPITIALLFALSTVAVLASSVAILRGKQQGLVAGIALLGTTIFMDLAASQYADVPLSFFILAAFACLAMAGRDGVGRSRWVSLSGLSAGLAAWTKNEGVMFLAVLVVARTLVLALQRNRKLLLEEMGWFLAGLAPVLLIIVHFKMFHAPGNWIAQSRGIVEKVLDPGRYAMILGHYIRQNWAFPLPLYAGYLALLGVRTDERDRTQLFTFLLCLVVMVFAFSGVYLITPINLDEHLRNSVDRLFVQLWPGFLFAFFLSVRPPIRATTPVDGRPAPRRQR